LHLNADMTINNNISEDTKNLEEKAGSGMDCC
jgi:hypothetical protein